MYVSQYVGYTKTYLRVVVVSKARKWIDQLLVSTV